MESQSSSEDEKESIHLYDYFRVYPDCQFYVDEKSPMEAYCLWLYEEKLNSILILRSSPIDPSMFERIGMPRIGIYDEFWDDVDTSVMRINVI
jgi:hypothetical protein